MPAPKSSAPVEVGDVVDSRYELQTLVSQHGRETMFRGRQVSLNRDVAVKVLNANADTDDERRFFNEARALAQLQHPNCMQVLEYGETQAGVKFIAINFTGGHPLTLDLGEPMPESRAVLYIKDILQGLEHAHSRGVAHRELSPDAIMVSGNLDGHERAVITEFGGAGTTDISPALTLGEMLSGDPKYASPEQGAGLAPDESSDLYSAGIIFYELLTGSPPFHDEDPAELLQMHLEQPLPHMGPNVSDGLANIIRKLAAKQRHERYATASEALQDLERHLNALSSVSGAAVVDSDAAAPTTPGVIDEEGQPPAGRRTWMFVAAAVAVGAVAFAGFRMFASTPEATTPPAPAAASVTNAEDAKTAAYVALLAQVNDSTNPLDFGPRHQALSVLAETDYDKNVDRRLQTKLDLLQANSAPTPCPVFVDALDRAMDDQGQYFTATIEGLSAPPSCDEGAARLAAARGREEAKDEGEDEDAAEPVEAATADLDPRPTPRVAKRKTPPKKQRDPAAAAEPTAAPPDPPSEPKPQPAPTTQKKKKDPFLPTSGPTPSAKPSDTKKKDGVFLSTKD